MSGLVFVLTLVAAFWALAYFAAPLWLWTGASAAALVADGWLCRQVPTVGWVVFLVIAIPMNLLPVRRALLTRHIFGWFRKVLPPISETERIAIDAGNTWWDADLFTGRPDWKKLLAAPVPALSDEEQAFLDGPVEEFCKSLDDWKITHELNDLPPDAWAHIRKHRYFGMIIPKQYGGLGFSALAHSTVVMKIGTRSTSAAVSVMVPNSLGPGELLMHYGTEEQKSHYLPRLARAEEIPCFALTGPYVGSDAGALPDTGIVRKEIYQGKETLGFRVSWDKRYITLAPIATVLGVAFKAYDPDHLLGSKEDLGITLALIPTNLPGVEIGPRHNPMNSSFMNGPTRGKDVFIPFECLIGGTQYIGKGWMMLMNCLAVGRAISLPALGTGAGKHTSRVTGAYARLRKQFRVPVGKFEGVEEALTRIAGTTYRMDAARRLTAGALDRGEKPSVLSAILKYHCTEGMRQVLADAMDVHGGRGVMLGPRNYLARAYQAVPVSITVEGANILTRSMIIFGQGAIRAHPYLLKEMEAASSDDQVKALVEFDRALFAHIGFTVSNAARALFLGLTGALLVSAPSTGSVRRHYRQLSRMSAAFTFTADVALLMLGGEMKRREKLSARFGDILSHLYLASASLKHFEDQGRPESDLPLVEWACRDSLYVMQTRLEEILRNFPSRPMGWLLRVLVLPLGRPYAPPGDRLGHAVAKILLVPSDARDRLTRHAYTSKDPSDPVGRVENALKLTLASEPVEEKLQQGLKQRLMPANYLKLIDAALAKQVITAEEATLLRETYAVVRDAIDVDEFPGRTAI
ncbi:MAG TPA: acyl-CoA dehydrogenase [Gammaproteobacteria bacterium]|nr:acyl-CoA dehydrogenase [Gammaproteobacteria bacterium]